MGPPRACVAPGTPPHPRSPRWWSECGTEAFNTGLDGVARSPEELGGLQVRPSVPAARWGSRASKVRRRTTPSVRFTTGVIRVEADRKHVTLPRVGTIKTHESTRKLARRLETGTARILSATVRRDAGRWYCAFTV